MIILSGDIAPLCIFFAPFVTLSFIDFHLEFVSLKACFHCSAMPLFSSVILLLDSFASEEADSETEAFILCHLLAVLSLNSFHFVDADSFKLLIFSTAPDFILDAMLTTFSFAAAILFWADVFITSNASPIFVFNVSICFIVPSFNSVDFCTTQSFAAVNLGATDDFHQLGRSSVKNFFTLSQLHITAIRAAIAATIMIPQGPVAANAPPMPFIPFPSMVETVPSPPVIAPITFPPVANTPPIPSLPLKNLVNRVIAPPSFPVACVPPRA